MIECLAELVNADARLVERGRFVHTTFLLEAGETGYLVRIVDGRIVSVTRGPFVTPNYSFCAARAARGVGVLLATRAGAGIERHLRPVQARPCASRATCIR